MDRPLLDKLCDYTILNHQFKLFFLALNNSFNISTYGRTYRIYTDIAAIGRYQLILLANGYIGQALVCTFLNDVCHAI